MIEYINTKGLQGVFHERKEIYMPERAEVTSDKYTNMWVSMASRGKTWDFKTNKDMLFKELRNPANLVRK